MQAEIIYQSSGGSIIRYFASPEERRARIEQEGAEALLRLHMTPGQRRWLSTTAGYNQSGQ